ncbi:MAG: pyridoxamine 5'-phosphate oxidase family protein [Eggerthellaceae bacterium]|nr:pyridoxamine 5'-phosphate oxidase family protein [Eggerthellaceae bacterium]
MFREMRRSKQQLSEAECIRILKNELRGVLSVLGDDDYPYGMPLNHYYSEEDGKLYFHGSMQGHKIDAMKKHDKASFCVYDEGFRKEGDWALSIRSVIVFGRIEFVNDLETVSKVADALSRKFTDDDDYIAREIKNAGPRTLMFALVPEHITGKIVNES